MKASFILVMMVIFPTPFWAQEYGNDTETIVDVELPGKYEVIGCEPVYDLTDPNEPIFAWLPLIEEVAEGKQNVFPEEDELDGNEKVLVGHDWIRIDQFDINKVCALSS